MTEITTTPESAESRFEAPHGGRGATPQGTRAFAQRHAGAFEPGYFRPASSDLVVSSLGCGTYLGADTDSDDAAYTATIRAALARGVNVIDTAINYRCQRSERAAGRALSLAIKSGEIRREEIVVCTKGGYVPLDLCPPNTAEGYKGYLRREFFGRRVMSASDIVAGGHSLAPGFIEDCIARSRRNLGLDTIDIYYIHNPEQQLAVVDRDELMRRMRAAFELLEEKVARGEIGSYGCATWNAFRMPSDDRSHMSLHDLVALARAVGGDDHGFRAVQLPLSLAMAEAIRSRTQPAGGDGGALLPAIPAAKELGLAVFTSAPLMQGQLTANLPASIADAIPGFRTDAQRAAAFARGAPGVTSTLIGMRSAAHLAENLEGAAVSS
jgi:aryl-alcohol dehydrogenase-like predicted oxidoreductase